MAKPGRKPLLESEKRKHLVACRLTDDELEVLLSGKPVGMTRGEWIRTKALKRKLPKVIPALNQKAWSNLGKNMGDLHRVTNEFLTNKSGENVKELLQAIKILRTEIKNCRDFLIGLKRGEE